MYIMSVHRLLKCRPTFDTIEVIHRHTPAEKL